ncbi:MAG TPA: hypothetical protein VKZ95_03730 [Sphingobacteriaceae bacterium]|nr:hypothetical protein [Sphingobacteriaceae bacterium]
MNPIIQALYSGHTIKKVLDYLAKSNPALASKISMAATYGYPLEKILKHIMQGGKSSSPSLPDASAQDLSLYDKMQYNLPKEMGMIARGAGYAAAGLGLAYGLDQFNNQQPTQQQPTPVPLPQQQAVPIPQQQPIPVPLPQQQATPIPIPQQQAVPLPQQHATQQQAAPIQRSQQQAIPQVQQQAMPPVQQQAPIQIPTANIFDSLIKGVDLNSLSPERQKRLNFLKTVSNNLQSKGLTENDRAFNSVKKKIKEILSKPETFGERELERLKTQYPDTDKSNLIKKGVDVVAPNGIIGKIKSLSGNNILIETDGMIQKFKANQVYTPPIPVKELDELYTDLISGIEKKTGQQVSRSVNFAGFDPKNNALAFQPNSGGLYIYENIDEKRKNKLTELLKRKTSGESFIGAWEEGTDSPIGSQMSALIKEIQKERGGKENEYSFKFDTVYDAIEPAKIEKAKKLRIQEILQLKQKKETKVKKLEKLGLSPEKIKELFNE